MFDFTKFYTKFVSVFVVLTLCFAPLFEVYAVPAYPGLVKVKQSDGSTLEIRIQGDEYFNWKTTEQGYNVVERDGLFYYANYLADGTFLASDERVMINGRKINPSSKIKIVNMGRIASNVAGMARAARASDALAEGAFPNEGDVKAVVILVEYSDVKFVVDNPNQAFTNQLNEEGYSVEGAVGSARDYFYANSGGKFKGEFDVYGPYELGQPQRFYGGNAFSGGDLRPSEMIEEAVTLADQDGVDFAQYDYNDDGKIDNVFVYYAGRGENEGGGTDCVWPHKWNVPNQPVFDGKILDVYACTSELRGANTDPATICGIGTFCHEFSHVFGLADHYDTTGEVNGYGYGLGNYDLMTMGSYNSNGNIPPLHTALERMMIGWAEPEELSEEGDYTLAPLADGKVYKMETDTEGEFFLFENRNKKSSIWESALPGEGLIISHVDQSAPYLAAWEENCPNGDTSHECYRLINASGGSVDFYDGWQNIPYPYKDLWYSYKNNNEWSPNSTPKSKSWSGSFMPLQLTDITKSGEDVKFTVSSAFVNSFSAEVMDTSGNYIEGASFTITSEADGTSISGTTTESGALEIGDEYLPNGRYTLEITADGFAPYTNTFDLVQGTEFSIALYSDEQGRMPELKHHNNSFDHAVNGGMVIITSDMLKKYVGCSIQEVRYYAAGPAELQFIIQKGLYGMGWSPGPLVVAENELGWRTVDFRGTDRSGGDIVIEPFTDYYIKTRVMVSSEAAPAFGMDNSTDRSLYKYSSLFEPSAGTTPELIYDSTGSEGNLLFSLAVSEESIYVAPTGFNTNPIYDEGVNLSINEQLNMSWASIPANGNPSCDWTSSDERVVKVNGSGAMFGVAEGEATVTGVSVLDPEVKMEFKVKVSRLEAQAKGRVVKFNTEEGVEGISLKFYQIENEFEAAAPLQSAVSALKAADVSELDVFDMKRFSVNSLEGQEYVEATSDSNGDYLAEGLVAGSRYYIVLEQDPYNDPWRSQTRTLYTPLLAYDNEIAEEYVNDLGTFSLFTNTIYGTQPFSYFEGEPELQSAGDNTAPILYAIRVPASELKDRIGHEITHSAAYVYNLVSAYMEAVIFSLTEDGGLILHGGTAHGEIDTELIEGQHIFEFINQDKIIIRPETDYYVGLKMMGEMGAQSSPDNKNNGYSNLVLYGDEFKSINELGLDDKVDWQLMMFTTPREIDPVSSISVSPVDYDVEPLAGSEYAFQASVSPSTATYLDYEWSVSDESVATIDKDGVATLLKAGEVDIIATSIEYPDVSGKYRLNVVLKQGIAGRVIDSDGNSVAGATVNFFQTNKLADPSGILSRMIFTRTAQVGTSLKSDENGEFFAELEEGTYEVEVEREGLMSYQGLASVVYGLNYQSFMMYQYVEELSEFVTYASPGIDGMIGDESYNFTPYTIWEPAALEPYVGKFISRLKAIVIGVVDIRFLIFDNNTGDIIYRSELISVEDYMVKMLVHDIPTEHLVKIEEGRSYAIGYEVANYESTSSPAVVSSQSKVYSGISDCIIFRNNVTTLTQMFGEQIGNWAMGFYVQDSEQLKGLDVTVGQCDAVVTWNPRNYDSFRVSYGVEGGELVSQTITDCKIEIEGLDPDTTYDIVVEGVEADGNFTELVHSTFTTLKKVSTIPMVQLQAYNDYKSGEILNLKTLNTVSSDNVEWYYDSEKLERNVVVLESGEHKVQCRVTRGSKCYVTTRYINVK